MLRRIKREITVFLPKHMLLRKGQNIGNRPHGMDWENRYSALSK